MVTFPPCKINLGLHIISRRPGGYHAISTCFYPLPWTDILEVLPSDAPRFTQTGIAIPGKGDDNLCWKSYHLLKKDFPLPPVQIHLHKTIPTGAGLGGGSSDAAHMLRVLNSVFELDLSGAQLMNYAAQIGSDCAFFIQDAPLIGSGRGEILEPAHVNLKGYYLVLLTPGIHISTPEAYAAVTPHQPAQPIQQLLERPINGWKDELHNDFETSVFKKHPNLQEIKESLYSHGALYASMSGSGSSLFGIFDEEVPAESYFRDSLGWSGWV